jgi:hypothetical protein
MNAETADGKKNGSPTVLRLIRDALAEAGSVAGSVPPPPAEVAEAIRNHAGKTPEACSDEELSAVQSALYEEYRNLARGDDAPRKRNNKLAKDLCHYHRRRWQEECKWREAQIRSDFLAGYDLAVVGKVHPDEIRNVNIAAGYHWGACIGDAHGGDESLDPEYLAKLRFGLCEAHVAAMRFARTEPGWVSLSNPYPWIAKRLEKDNDDEEAA